jgi:hypothetical protein
MKGLTDYITEQPWENTLIATYVLIVDRLEQASQRANFVRRRGPTPDYDDAQIVTIALAADFWFSGDEEKTLHFLRPCGRVAFPTRRASTSDGVSW